MAALQRIVLFTRDLSAAVKFWNVDFGLTLLSSSPTWAQLSAGNGISLQIRETYSESHLTSGYAPILQFQVPDMDTLVPQLLMAGARLDGAIQYTPAFKLAMLRAPTGEMLSLLEDNPLADPSRTHPAHSPEMSTPSSALR